MFCINSTKSSNLKLYQHFGVLATFVVRSCAEDLHPTVVIYLFYLRDMLKLVYICYLILLHSFKTVFHIIKKLRILYNQIKSQI